MSELLIEFWKKTLIYPQAKSLYMTREKKWTSSEEKEKKMISDMHVHEIGLRDALEAYKFPYRHILFESNFLIPFSSLFISISSPSHVSPHIMACCIHAWILNDWLPALKLFSLFSFQNSSYNCVFLKAKPSPSI